MKTGHGWWVVAAVLVVITPAAAEDTAGMTIVAARDPAVAEEDGTYVLLSSGPGLPVHTSKDLVVWTATGRVFDRAEVMEAPTVARFGGKWHLYFTVASPKHVGGVVFHAVSSALDPAHESCAFSDPQALVTDAVLGGGHPHVAVDEAGRPWLFWTSPDGGVFCSQLDPATGRRMSGARALRIASSDRETGGACHVKHGEHHYLLVTAGKDRVLVGRATRLQGPYEDFNGTSLCEGGGTLLVATDEPWLRPAGPHALTTEHGTLLVHQAFRADTRADVLAVRPLLWPGEGWPVCGDVGSMRSWRDAAPDRIDVIATWMHAVDFGPENPIWYSREGKLQRHDAPHRWVLEGNRLELRWPRDDAPGGVWVDRCLVSSDARYYVGRNQSGMVIRGRNRDMSPSPWIGLNGALLEDLPAHVKAPEGKLTLYADYEHESHGRIDLYLVNRTPNAVPVPNILGKLDVYLWGRPGSTWERAETGGEPVCGMSWRPLALRAGRFFRVTRVLPALGIPCTIRFQYQSAPAIVSNEGPGRVNPEDIAAARVDHLAAREGDFETVAEIALGEREASKEVRRAAIGALERFDSAASVQVLLDLLKTTDGRERILVLWALGGSGKAGKAAIPALRELLDHADPDVRERAERSIAILERE